MGKNLPNPADFAPTMSLETTERAMLRCDAFLDSPSAYYQYMLINIRK